MKITLFEKCAMCIVLAMFFIGVGYAWCFHQDKEIAKWQQVYEIKKELQSGKHSFFVGDVKFSPTKYKGLWLVKVVE